MSFPKRLVSKEIASHRKEASKGYPDSNQARPTTIPCKDSVGEGLAPPAVRAWAENKKPGSLGGATRVGVTAEGGRRKLDKFLVHLVYGQHADFP